MRIGVDAEKYVDHPARNILLKGLENPNELRPRIQAAVLDLWKDAAVDVAPASTGVDSYIGFNSLGNEVLAHASATNLMDMNAKGNGNTDDTAAFMAAVAKGAPIFLPMGRTFILDKVTLATDVVLIAHWGATLKRKTTATTGSWINVTASRFIARGVTFDGNKANNANACHNILINTGCVLTDIRDCIFQNAKLVGGYGDGIHFAPGHITGRHYVLDCIGRDNDGHGVGASDVYGLRVQGGDYFANGQNGIALNNYDLTLVQKIKQCIIKGVTTRSNLSSGIGVGNFIEDNNFSASPRLYGFANATASDVHIEECHSYSNERYGIAAYGDYIYVKNNVMHHNGDGGAVFGGLNFVARYSECSGNTAYLNDSYGLDCGSCVSTVIKNNLVMFNCITGGSGVTLEASVNVKFYGNTVENNGGVTTVQISVYRNGGDGAGSYFPYLASAIHIFSNHIGVSSSQVGIKVYDGADDIHIIENTFQGTDATKFIQCLGDQGIIKNNNFPTNITNSYALDGASAITYADGFEEIFFTGTGTIEGVRPQSMVTVGDGIAWIDVTAPGTGYTSSPTVVFTGGGGTGATATAFVRAGVVIGVRMNSFGSGYTSAPAISFTGGGGSGATATAQWKLKLQARNRLTIYCLSACLFKRASTIAPVIENPDNKDIRMQAAASIQLLSYANQWRLVSKTKLDAKIQIADGIAAPAADVGYGQLFIDSADGDLKVIFGDGVVKTIVVDT